MSITTRPTTASPDMRRVAVLLLSALAVAASLPAAAHAIPSSTSHAASAPSLSASADPVAPTSAASDRRVSARADIWQKLRTGRGYAILLRHALAPGTGDPAGFRLGDCSTQRNLSLEGRRQAIAIGAQWRRERVPVDRVLTSRWCRARDTARLLAVGTVTAYPDFDSSFTVSSTVAQRRTAKVRGIITRHRDQPGVLVLVGHQVNITALTGMVPSSGAAVVVKATSTGTLRVIGVLPAV
ncbi:MAG: histidine phosphatase family protein [Candidatus Nanopelagicales bacterium]|jgi:phosphohistidine phosphatase SixA|nr:histidine phosphatase family protein [Candidatus Nanopelagicales bacterium]MDP4905631.1 histidine phosphatase family protein [Candidatus Nanopelagicales bacterium]MDP4974016.1 histidine phosphatase family protein [Candidatus Nanopelagicales bacterium]